MKAFGYIRVSTTDQADSGLGLQAQRDAITKEYEIRLKPAGYEWGGMYEDPAVKGGRQFLSRPAGLQMSVAGNGGDAFVFSKLDRAFRSTLDCLHTVLVWQKRGIRLVFIDLNLDTQTPMGEFALTIMAGASQLERRMIGLRTKEGLAVAKSKGKHWGQPLMTIKHVRDEKGNLTRYVRPDVFALGQKVIEWRNRSVGWEAIRRTLRDGGVIRPKTKIVSVFRENPWWGATALQNLHRATLITQMWLSSGKAKWPKGWAAPATLDVKDISDATKA